MWMGFLKRFSETCIFHQKKGKNFDRRKVDVGKAVFLSLLTLEKRNRKGFAVYFQSINLVLWFTIR